MEKIAPSTRTRKTRRLPLRVFIRNMMMAERGRRRYNAAEKQRGAIDLALAAAQKIDRGNRRTGSEEKRPAESSRAQAR